MSRHARVHDVEQVLERLAAAEREIPLFGDQPERRVHFRRLGAWLVEERFLRSLLLTRLRRGRQPAPPSFADIGVLPLLLVLGFSPRQSARCRSQVIYLKRHARAFFLSPRPLSLKLLVPAERDRLARELAARTQVEGRVPVPRLLAHRLDGPHPYLCEELIFGRRPDRKRDEHLVMKLVLDRLWDSYRAVGFEWRRCHECHQLDSLFRTFETAPDLWKRWPGDWPKQSEVRDSLTRLGDETEKLIPCSLGHGDLSDGNMLVSNDRITLLDWERARRRPVLAELAKVMVQYPKSFGPIMSRMEEEFTEVPPPGMVSPRSQAALVALQRVANLRTRYSAERPTSALGAYRAKWRYRQRMAAELKHLARVLRADSHRAPWHA